MASTSFLYILVSLILSLSHTTSKTTPSPPYLHSIVLPITKATSSFSPQYTTSIKLQTHKTPSKLTLDLGGDNLWAICSGPNTNPSLYRPAVCNSTPCKLASGGCEECHGPSFPGCHPKMCTVPVANRMTDHLLGRELALDNATLTPTATIPNLIIACGISSILEGLADGVVGMAGLGRGQPVSLPSQVFRSFNLSKKFAVCLSPNATGVIIFGDKPYSFPPHADASVFLLHTPLIMNPFRIPFLKGDRSPEYYVNLTSIRVNGKDLPLNKTLLRINENGVGGTMFSTIKPYTVMHSSIYRVFRNAFVKELSHVPRVKAVAPYGICYASKSLPGMPLVGPFVDLVMHHKDVFWRIYGGNSMVKVKNGEVVCLGFVDGGEYAETGIVIGGHQMENSLLQFDLENSRLGFTSTLLLHGTSCDKHDLASRR